MLDPALDSAMLLQTTRQANAAVWGFVVQALGLLAASIAALFAWHAAHATRQQAQAAMETSAALRHEALERDARSRAYAELAAGRVADALEAFFPASRRDRPPATELYARLRRMRGGSDAAYLNFPGSRPSLVSPALPAWSEVRNLLTIERPTLAQPALEAQVARLAREWTAVFDSADALSEAERSVRARIDDEPRDPETYAARLEAALAAEALHRAVRERYVTLVAEIAPLVLALRQHPRLQPEV